MFARGREPNRDIANRTCELEHTCVACDGETVVAELRLDWCNLGSSVAVDRPSLHTRYIWLAGWAGQMRTREEGPSEPHTEVEYRLIHDTTDKVS